jgi:hypothetical protein
MKTAVLWGVASRSLWESQVSRRLINIFYIFPTLFHVISLKFCKKSAAHAKSNETAELLGKYQRGFSLLMYFIRLSDVHALFLKFALKYLWKIQLLAYTMYVNISLYFFVYCILFHLLFFVLSYLRRCVIIMRRERMWASFSVSSLADLHLSGMFSFSRSFFSSSL